MSVPQDVSNPKLGLDSGCGRKDEGIFDNLMTLGLRLAASGPA